MKNDDLYSLVDYFRKTIERAVYDGRLLITPFSSFPDGCCDMVSELLAQFLYDHDIETIMVNGVSQIDHSYHVWLRTLDGINIDITAYQFEGKIRGIRNIPKTIVGPEDKVHGMFVSSRNVEEPMCFIDNIYDNKFRNSMNRRERDLCTAYNVLLDYYLQQA